jgi:hypothetical protein
MRDRVTLESVVAEARELLRESEPCWGIQGYVRKPVGRYPGLNDCRDQGIRIVIYRLCAEYELAPTRSKNRHGPACWPVSASWVVAQAINGLRSTRTGALVSSLSEKAVEKIWQKREKPKKCTCC